VADKISKKTTTASSLIALGLLTLAMIGQGVLEDTQYYCQDESSIIQCDSVSGGSQTRCYLNSDKTSWDYCRSGWIEIEDDTQIQDEPEQRKEVYGKSYVCVKGGVCTEK